MTSPRAFRRRSPLVAAIDNGLRVMLGLPAPSFLTPPLGVLIAVSTAWLAMTGMFDHLRGIPRFHGIANGMAEIAITMAACHVLVGPKSRTTAFSAIGIGMTVTWWLGSGFALLGAPKVFLGISTLVLGLRVHAYGLAMPGDRPRYDWAVLVILLQGLAIHLLGVWQVTP